MSSDFSLNNDYFGEVIVGIFFFFIIGCEFFINYKVTFRKKAVEMPIEPDDEEEADAKSDLALQEAKVEG